MLNTWKIMLFFSLSKTGHYDCQKRKRKKSCADGMLAALCLGRTRFPLWLGQYDIHTCGFITYLLQSYQMLDTQSVSPVLYSSSSRTYATKLNE